LYVDVGRCFKKVESKKIHRKEFEEMLKINKEIDPIEVNKRFTIGTIVLIHESFIALLVIFAFTT